MITMSEMRTYFKIQTNSDLDRILQKCAIVPYQFDLKITELNYLYCIIVYENQYRQLVSSGLKLDSFDQGLSRSVQVSI